MDPVENALTLALTNFTVTCLLLGLVAATTSLARKPKPLRRALVVEEVLAFFLLFSVGVASFYNFVMHVFFGDMTAHFIGWSQSPMVMPTAARSRLMSPKVMPVVTNIVSVVSAKGKNRSWSRSRRWRGGLMWGTFTRYYDPQHV